MGFTLSFFSLFIVFCLGGNEKKSIGCYSLMCFCSFFSFFSPPPLPFTPLSPLDDPPVTPQPLPRPTVEPSVNKRIACCFPFFFYSSTYYSIQSMGAQCIMLNQLISPTVHPSRSSSRSSYSRGRTPFYF